MSNYKRPVRVLCKRTLRIGPDYYYDEETDRQVQYDGRMLVKGDWYSVVPNTNDTEQTFTIIDNQKNPHLFYMYNEEDKKTWPDICKKYGPRDYAKWFFTPEELEKRELRLLKEQSIRC